MTQSQDLSFRITILERVSFDQPLFLKEWEKAKNALNSLAEQQALDSFVKEKFPAYWKLGIEKKSQHIGKLG